MSLARSTQLYIIKSFLFFCVPIGFGLVASQARAASPVDCAGLFAEGDSKIKQGEFSVISPESSKDSSSSSITDAPEPIPHEVLAKIFAMDGARAVKVLEAIEGFTPEERSVFLELMQRHENDNFCKI